MKSKEAELRTRMSVQDCGATFQQASAQAHGLGAKLGGFGAKVNGKDGSGFFTPVDDSPFAGLNDDAPAFTVGVIIPKFRNGANGNADAIHMYVWDRGDVREVKLMSPHGFGGGAHAGRLIAKFSDVFRTADPACEVSVTA